MKSKIKSGFTLAEIMVVLAIISIIILATVKIAQSKLSFGSRLMYYAAFSNLQKISTELIGQGCNSTDTTVCASPKSLPLVMTNASATNIMKDGGLCDRIADTANVIGTQNCAAPVVTDGTTDFSAQVPLFKTTNGMIWYAGTSASGETASPDDPDADSCKTGETEHNGYCEYTLTNATSIFNVPTTNLITTTVVGYAVYIDIDGSKGRSKLNEDVFKFFIYPDGTILPAGDSKGSTDSSFFSASAKKSDETYIVNHVTYKEAACKAGKIDTTKITDYCGTFTPVTGCAYGTSNECSVVTNKPGY